MTLKEKLLANIKITDRGCWEWQKNTFKKRGGYGIIYINRDIKRVHRISYQVFIGDIPTGLLVCHKCDNPPCINPEHLFLGTYQDNNSDKAKKGRSRNGSMKRKIF